MKSNMRSLTLLVLAAPLIICLAGGCKGNSQAADKDEITVLVTSNSPEERETASKRLAAQGDRVIPAILDAFTKAEGNKEAQLALLDAVIRMRVPDAQVAALEKMAAQTKDKDVREKASGFAHQLKPSH